MVDISRWYIFVRIEKKEIQTNAFFISSTVWTHHNSVFRGQAYVAISLHLFQMFVYLFTHVCMCTYASTKTQMFTQTKQ